MRLLVGIPAFNEAATIADVVRRIPRPIEGICEVQILVVDDGSTDETADLARSEGAQVVRHAGNRGVGTAFRTLAHQALLHRADLLVTVDGDGQFRPEDIPQLLKPILSDQADFVTGSRFVDPLCEPQMPRIKKWGNRRVAQLVSALIGRRLHDVSCGFRAYSREALLRLTFHQAFTYTHETILDLAAKNLRLCEIPLTIQGVRSHGESRVARNLWKYAWQTSLILLRFYRDHRPWRLCSFLALPLVMAGIILLIVSLIHLLQEGTWLKWAAFIGGSLLGVAVGIVFLGFLADISIRLRRNQEEMLYWLRKHTTESESHSHGSGMVSDSMP